MSDAGHTLPSRVQRWFDESRTLDRLFLWLDGVDLRRGRRCAQRVNDARARARTAR